MQKEYSALGNVMKTTKKFFSDFWDSVINLQYKSTGLQKMEEELVRLKKQLEYTPNTPFAKDKAESLKYAIAQQEYLIEREKERLNLESKAKADSSRNASITEERIAMEKKLEDSLDKSNKKLMTRSQYVEMYVKNMRESTKYSETWTDSLVAQAEKAANAEYDRMHRAEENKKIVVDGIGIFEEVYKRQGQAQNWLNSILDKSSNYTANYSEELEKLRKAHDEGINGIKISDELYERELAALESIQPWYKKMTAAVNELQKSMSDYNITLDERMKLVEQEYEMMGKTATEREQIGRAHV